MKTNFFRVLGEIILWVVANVVSVAVPTFLAFFLATEVFDISPALHPKLVWLYVIPFALATLTWGSWAALTWTRTRALRVGMRASASLPGLLLAGFGVFFMKSGFGLIPGIAMVGAGFGGVILSTFLSKTFGVKATGNTGVGLIAGLGVFPVIATIMAAGVGSLWIQLVVRSAELYLNTSCFVPMSHAIERFVSIPTVMITILTWTLISTVVPALASSIAQRVTKTLGF